MSERILWASKPLYCEKYERDVVLSVLTDDETDVVSVRFESKIFIRWSSNERSMTDISMTIAMGEGIDVNEESLRTYTSGIVANDQEYLDGIVEMMRLRVPDVLDPEPER